MNDDLEKENNESTRSATFSASQETKQAPSESKLGTPAVAFQSAEVQRNFNRAAEESQEEPSRKRKMSLRRRRRNDDGDQANEEVEARDESQKSDEVEGEIPVTFKRRRRRRSNEQDAQVTSEDPPNTVVRVRKPRERETGGRSSTRLEAKRQRRRDSRDVGRRRAPVLTEAEFLARREAVERVMVVREKEDRIQIAVLEDDILVEHYVSRNQSASLIGNVYLGKVQNVLPGKRRALQ